MKIFISWSGARSEALAAALREWFPLVLHYVAPWQSKADIQAGERWSIEVAKELEGCNFGVICVTKENVGAPWILFEAGALAKSMQDGRVIPLLLDLDFKDISGPLSQFQAKKVDSVGIRELIVSLNKAAPAPVPEPQLDKLITALWADLEKQVQAIPKASTSLKPKRPQDEILEELVAGVRNIDMKFRDLDGDFSKVRRRSMKFHPMMLREIGHFGSIERAEPLHVLLMASLLREEAPWLYELAAELYRASEQGNSRQARSAQRQMT
jgi:hypothetical protein